MAKTPKPTPSKQATPPPPPPSEPLAAAVVESAPPEPTPEVETLVTESPASAPVPAAPANEVDTNTLLAIVAARLSQTQRTSARDANALSHVTEAIQILSKAH